MRNWLTMAMSLLMNPRQLWRAGTPRSPKKGRLNEITVKGDKLARAHSRAGNVYGRKTWL